MLFATRMRGWLRSRTVGSRIMIVSTAAAAALGLTATVSIVAPESASAASIGPGFAYQGNPESFLGGYILPNGQIGYCPDPGELPPLTATSDGGIVTSYVSHGPGTTQNATALDSTTLGKINYLVTTYGQTGDSDVAAAVSMAVHTVANPAAYAAYTAPYGDSFYRTYMGAADWTRVTALAAQFRAEAASYVPSGSGSASMSFTVDNNNYSGSLNITAISPAGAPGTITLTNGKFTASDRNVLSGNFHAGDSFPVTGIPPADNSDYEISASATFTATGGPGGNVHMWITPGRQGLASPGTAAGTSFNATAHDPFDRTTAFAPVVSTSVRNQVVVPGDASTSIDRISGGTTSFVDPDTGRTIDNKWPFTEATQTQPNMWVPIIAKGTWYGPLVSKPIEGGPVPAGAPVAGHATVTLTGNIVSSINATAQSDTPPSEAGFYVWVWSIDAADQSVGVQSLLPPDYHWQDLFGLTSESGVSPAHVQLGTQLADPIATECNTTSDVITPALSGGAWLRDSDGNRIPVTLTGRVYHSDTEPVRSPTPDPAATLLETITAVLTGPTPVTSDPFSVGCQTGYVTVQWSIEAAAQDWRVQGYFDDWSDDYGVPAETVQVLGPTFATKATATGPGGDVTDTATITGPVPDAGIDLVWNGYLRPATSDVAVCDATTLHYTSSAPTTATKAGDYTSEVFTTPKDFLGSIDWVETATLHGTDTVLHQGVCGAPLETSLSALPQVATMPPSGPVAASTAVHDTLVVNGWVPAGSTAVVTLYKQTEGSAQLTCDASTQVGAPLAPVSIDAGLATDAKYTTADTGKLDAGNYGFVEQLLDSEGNVLTKGGCLDELFTVNKVLAFTGATLGGTLFGGAGLALLAGVLVVVIERQVRRMKAKHRVA